MTEPSTSRVIDPDRAARPPDLGSKRGGDRTRRRSRAAFVVAFIGLIACAASYLMALRAHDQRASAYLSSEAEHMVALVRDSIHVSLDRITALQGLLEASEHVTREEFERFVTRVGPGPGMGAIGFAPLVPGGDLADHERAARDELADYRVHGVDGESLNAEAEHFPILYLVTFADTPDTHGLSLTSEPVRRTTVLRARRTARPILSDFLGEPGEVLVAAPVWDAQNRFLGVVFANLQIERLIDDRISSMAADWLVWTLDDRTDEPGLWITETAVRDPLLWTDTLRVINRRWRLEVAGSYHPLQAERTGYSYALWLGVLATLLAAFGVRLLEERGASQAEVDRLRQLSEEKDRFLASVSHELRTPLTAVVGISSVLAEEGAELPDDERKEMVRAVEQEANELANLVEDLLTAGRLRAGALNVVLEHTRLDDEVSRVLNRLPVPPGRSVGVAQDLGEVWADPLRVRQIVRNLTANALRYADSTVQISSRRGEGVIALEVRNDGRPIPAATERRLFQPYVGRDPSGQPASIGLGLSITLQLARAMGGDVEYRHADGWTSFAVTLPAIPEQSPVPAVSSITP